MKFKRRENQTRYTGIHLHTGGKATEQIKTDVTIQMRKAIIFKDEGRA